MRKLSIARHAKSSWNDASQSDFDRPLNDRGMRDAPRMAERLTAQAWQPELVVSSPAVRAITTARHYAQALQLDGSRLIQEPRIYEASLQTLAYLVQEFPDDARHVLLVGHNPGFSELACWLAKCPFDDMPTCALAQLDLDVKQWSEVGPGCGHLAQYLFPKDGIA